SRRSQNAMIRATEKDSERRSHGVLPYATPGAAPNRAAHYAIASFCVAVLSIFWWPMDVESWMRIDYAKHDRIGAVAAILAIILGFASYRPPARIPRAGRVGLILG